MKTKRSNLIYGLLTLGAVLASNLTANAAVEASKDQSETSAKWDSTTSQTLQISTELDMDLVLEQLGASQEVLRERLRVWVDEKEAAYSRQHAELVSPLVTLARK